MRQISAKQIADTVARLCIEANCHLGSDIEERIEFMHAQESWPQAKEILERIIENYRIAHRENVPVCQDTGMACVF